MLFPGLEDLLRGHLKMNPASFTHTSIGQVGLLAWHNLFGHKRFAKLESKTRRSTSLPQAKIDS